MQYLCVGCKTEMSLARAICPLCGCKVEAVKGRYDQSKSEEKRIKIQKGKKQK